MKTKQHIIREYIRKEIKKALSEEGAKPDYLDMDKDGNKKEPMKKALKDKEKLNELDANVQTLRDEYLKKIIEFGKHLGTIRDLKLFAVDKGAEELHDKIFDASHELFKYIKGELPPKLG